MAEKTQNVLIVDDDESITWTIQSFLLKKKPTLKIYQAHTGMEAFGYIRQLKSLELLITDIHMPQLTGIELLQKLQSYEIKPVIFVMTGFGSPELHSQAEKLGAVRYFTKPFDISEMADVALQSIDKKVTQTKSPGFAGSFGNLKMVDIIQINCLIRQTGLLKVEAGESAGKIYFNDGNIIHSETTRNSGEEAVYEIIGWGSGKFDFMQQVRPARKSIEKGWEYLLMEQARRVDSRT